MLWLSLSILFLRDFALIRPKLHNLQQARAGRVMRRLGYAQLQTCCAGEGWARQGAPDSETRVDPADERRIRHN